MLINGRCHCGNISFTLDWSPDPVEINARVCGCSFCTRHGGAWTSKPGASLRLSLADEALVSRYAFGTRTAEFLVCRRCGVVPAVTSTIDGRLYAVVNVNTFENVDPAIVRRAPSSFEGEVTDARLGRRMRVWIADVDYTTCPL